ncbi:hypothetical protein Ataiwa_12350 [Algoriphagus taiwanensis]|uniref:Uncharacterized protein n=1 Tax=Algoriphagus taiwanensis TaxID=1445656 RepID=A0ABQ6Q0I7_9BACT|nr:hypothetical protein Ataiwa_12350 [Algoriphagus taiwanensis]
MRLRWLKLFSNPIFQSANAKNLMELKNFNLGI